MKKLPLILLSLSLSVSAFAAAPATLDKKAFAEHIRKALNLDTRADIQVPNDPVPSGISTMQLVTVTIAGQPYPVFITKDYKQYIWGFAVNMTTDPDKERMKGIDLKDAHSQGSPSAPITIVEYSDLQCSHCKEAHEALKAQLYKDYTKEQIRFVAKAFPLTGHDWAEAAAVATECGSQQMDTAYWDLVNYYFTNQEKINKDNLKQFTDQAVKDLKLDGVALDNCIKAGVALAKVQGEKKEGLAVGVNSTPAFFINGRMRRGYRDFEDFKIVIDEKLKEVKK